MYMYVLLSLPGIVNFRIQKNLSMSPRVHRKYDALLMSLL